MTFFGATILLLVINIVMAMVAITSYSAELQKAFRSHPNPEPFTFIPLSVWIAIPVMSSIAAAFASRY